MINTRLVRYLESNNLISPVQSGFRSEHSTNDNLIRLETFIRDAFIKKEHVVAVFFLFGKSLRYYLEIWHFTWFTWIRTERSSANFYKKLPCGSLCASTSWFNFIWPIWAGTGCSTGQHSLYHPIQYQNEQHCKLFRSEDRGFIICWRFLHML